MAGTVLRQLVKQGLEAKKPLQLLGTINPYCALMVKKAGGKAIYLSGSGVATASHGIPDLGITDLHDVLEDVRRITSSSKLPLLVDVDTGFGGAFNIIRCTRELAKSGAAGCHIEDQVQAKRCGHRPNKQLVSANEMQDRIRSAIDGRNQSGLDDFVIMARTDALAEEGLSKALKRCEGYIEAGADMLFPEAVHTLEEYTEFARLGVPILANITEFGQTPMFTQDELGKAGVGLVLYPLSAFRAMNAAALNTYKVILTEGTQKSAIPYMQTRKELYEILNYHYYEETLDRLFLENEQEEEE